MIPLTLSAVFTFIESAYKFAQLANNVYETGSENEVFVRTILRVRSDMDEAERLLAIPATRTILDRHDNMEKKLWAENSILGAKAALNDIGKRIEQVRADYKRDGDRIASLRSLGHRLQWVFGGQDKVKTRQGELAACHQSLSVVLNFLHTLQSVDIILKLSASMDVTCQTPPTHSQSIENFRGPASRRKKPGREDQKSIEWVGAAPKPSGPLLLEARERTELSLAMPSLGFSENNFSSSNYEWCNSSPTATLCTVRRQAVSSNATSSIITQSYSSTAIVSHTDLQQSHQPRSPMRQTQKPNQSREAGTSTFVLPMENVGMIAELDSSGRIEEVLDELSSTSKATSQTPRFTELDSPFFVGIPKLGSTAFEPVSNQKLSEYETLETLSFLGPFDFETPITLTTHLNDHLQGKELSKNSSSFPATAKPAMMQRPKSTSALPPVKQQESPGTSHTPISRRKKRREQMEVVLGFNSSYS